MAVHAWGRAQDELHTHLDYIKVHCPAVSEQDEEVLEVAVRWSTIQTPGVLASTDIDEMAVTCVDSLSTPRVEWQIQVNSIRGGWTG